MTIMSVNMKLFTDADGGRPLVINFNHRFQNSLFHVFPPWNLCETHVWNWSQYINYLNATPCLKSKETGFMFDCWMQCSIFDCSVMFDCLSVQFPKVWLCWIGQVFGWVQLCSIAEPNRSESNDWRSIGFNYRTFDWLRGVKSLVKSTLIAMSLTARYADNTFLFIWQRIGCCGKFWLWATWKPLYPTTIKGNL